MRPGPLLLLGLGTLLLASLPAQADPRSGNLFINDHWTEHAGTVAGAVPLDPSEDAQVNFRMVVGEGTGLEGARAFALIDLPGLDVPLGSATVHPVGGNPDNLVANVPLGALERLGSGIFWVRVGLVDASGAMAFEDEFLVRLHDSPVVTAEGVALAAASLLVAFGVWRLVINASDLFFLWVNRPEPQDKDAKGEDPPAAGVREAVQQANAAPWVGWTLTCFGASLTVASWIQFLGFLPLDTDLIVTALEFGVGLFTLGVVAYALARRRARRRVGVPRPAAGTPGSSP